MNNKLTNTPRILCNSWEESKPENGRYNTLELTQANTGVGVTRHHGILRETGYFMLTYIAELQRVTRKLHLLLCKNMH